MITLKTLIRAKAYISVSTVLRDAFEEPKHRSRINNKIYRGRPELTKQESASISKALAKKGVRIEP